MRKRVFLLVSAVVAFALLGAAAEAPAGMPLVLVFYEEGCPDCAIMEELLEGLATDLPPDAVQRIEISEPGALDLLARLEAAYDFESSTVPILFVGDHAIIGAGRTQEFALRDAVGRCATSGCPSPLQRIRGGMLPWLDLAELALVAALAIVASLLQLP